ncbi:hypothetical protein D4Q71_10085 [Rhodopseudomonas palustris]|nr:hypothetical protein CKO39_07330 [Rhodopseudomonas palustris]QLH72464.1 hypothetical protein HZF03_17380 [Rhodopseudomonas palustris]RIA03643.1 hypothetical protein D1920_01030 [Rhodopseudomonas palustris]RJF65123.1 hypothetical protein D4Q71_10085 [Rhodopseudomonas palustris]
MMEGTMAEVVIPDVAEETIAIYRERARLHGRSLEEELRDLLESHRPFSRAERAALSRRFLSEYPDVQPSLTAEERREGLM